uniref:Uncharacterized protein n=1 Tax=viral metagenome TaxID=1070528 RepID=A0A6C0E8G9_9ZZZZ
MYIIYSSKKNVYCTSYKELILDVLTIVNINHNYKYYRGNICYVRIVVRLNDKVILGDRYYIYNIKIIKKFKLCNND